MVVVGGQVVERDRVEILKYVLPYINSPWKAKVTPLSRETFKGTLPILVAMGTAQNARMPLI